jgi:DNA-binding CsgD family transcriptional regulator
MLSEHLFCYNLTMSVWQKLLYWLGLRQDPGPRYFELSDSLHTTLSTLAEYAGQPENELAEAIFASGLETYYSVDAFWAIWEGLTLREKDVTALTCLGYTNRQMAVFLGISAETVKTHVANALRKFDLHSKADLRVALSVWNFSKWEEE